MKNIIFLTATAAMMIFAVSCGQKSKSGSQGSLGSLKVKTIYVDDVIYHPMTEEAGLKYEVNFTYPSAYGDKTVLETLQQKIIIYSLGEKYSLLSPEEAVNAYIADRKAEYLEEIIGRRIEVSGCWIVCNNEILFVSDTLFQLNVVSSEQWVGSRYFETPSSTVFNIKTGAEYNEGTVINGVIWATRNVAAPGTFADAPEDAGMFYKWNSKKAWAATGDEVSDWDAGIHDGDVWAKSNDPSPAGWHVPTDAEIRTLFDADKVSSEWTIQNSIIGCKFTDKAIGNSIFFPAFGYRSGYDGTLNLVGMQGNYWTGTTGCPDCSYGMYVCDYNVGLNDGENRDMAFNIRPVAD